MFALVDATRKERAATQRGKSRHLMSPYMQIPEKNEKCRNLEVGHYIITKTSSYIGSSLSGSNLLITGIQKQTSRRRRTPVSESGLGFTFSVWLLVSVYECKEFCGSPLRCRQPLPCNHILGLLITRGIHLPRCPPSAVQLKRRPASGNHRALANVCTVNARQ